MIKENDIQKLGDLKAHTEDKIVNSLVDELIQMDIEMNTIMDEEDYSLNDLDELNIKMDNFKKKLQELRNRFNDIGLIIK